MMNNIARIPHIAAYNEFQLVDMMHSSEGCRGMAGENPGLGLRARNLFDDALARKHDQQQEPLRCLLQPLGFNLLVVRSARYMGTSLISSKP